MARARGSDRTAFVLVAGASVFWLGAHLLRGPAAVSRASVPPAALGATTAPAPAPDATATPPATAPAARVSPRTRADARAAFDRRIAATGKDATVSAADREALVTALARVRRASRRSQASTDNLALQAKRERILLDSDRLFRATLGMGIADFVAAEDAPDQAEDVARR
jgi:hypothetical protein